MITWINDFEYVSNNVSEICPSSSAKGKGLKGPSFMLMD